MGPTMDFKRAYVTRVPYGNACPIWQITPGGNTNIDVNAHFANAPSRASPACFIGSDSFDWLITHKRQHSSDRASRGTIKEAAIVSNLAGSFVTIATRRSPTVAQAHMKCITQRSTSDTTLVDDNARIYCPFTRMLQTSARQ